MVDPLASEVGEGVAFDLAMAPSTVLTLAFEIVQGDDDRAGLGSQGVDERLFACGTFPRQLSVDFSSRNLPSMSQRVPTRQPHDHILDVAHPPPRPGTSRAVLLPVAIVLLIGTVFVSVYLAAFHAPRPHQLRVGTTMIGTHQVDLRRDLARAIPGGFTLETYPDESTARQAVQHRFVYAAYLGGGRLLYGSANGAAVTATMTTAFGSVARAEHDHLSVEDVAPAAAGDTRGLSVFYTAFGLVLAGYLFGMTTYQVAPRLQYRWRMASLALFGVVGGVLVAAIAGSAGFGALPGPFLPLAIIVALMGAAVGATTMVLLRLFGSAGVSLASILLLILGNASSGGIMPPAYLPAWLRPLSEILPVGVGVRAMQGLSRFQNDGLSRALVILPLWVLGAAVVLHLKDVFRRDDPSGARDKDESQPAVG
ncbi:ABC transporter permease [Frankia sp. EAN1pec]|uniref:ABC transporter permease n=1 Tax=Parafrankia sp. (strain EAN1pec) TaxID=298653 RepID=UPI0018DD4C53